MRALLLLVLACLSMQLHAQQVETYTSSGKPAGAMRKQQQKKQQKGFDPSRMIYGGTVNLGGGSGAFSIGVLPMIGYRITDRLGAGVNFGYQYTKINDYIELTDLNGISQYYDYKASMITAGVWARYLVLPKLFVHAGYEHNFINFQNYRYSSNGSGSIEDFKQHFKAPSVLVGIGYRAPIGANISMYFMGMVDILQLTDNPPAYSPYYYNKSNGILSAIYPNIGFNIGF
ncbi:MAG TPA: hypothetical protein VL098_07210 [Flavipsychrobacter sp.]|nr:hypothetical protein [Flavipsychrobacter sp.]